MLGPSMRIRNEKTARIALHQSSPRLGDVEANLESLAAASDRAVREKASLLVGPELGLTGYHLKDAVPDAAIDPRSKTWKTLERLSKRIDIVAGFVEKSDEQQYYNAAAWFSGGRLLHLHRKIYLPTYGMFDEQRYFARGARVATFNTRFGRSGLLVCEDLWHPSAVYLASLQGLEFLAVPSSSPMRGVRKASVKKGKAASSVVWEEMNRTYARMYSTGLLYVNRVGVEDGVAFSGGSHLLDPAGETVGQAPCGEEALLMLEFDPGHVRRARLQTPVIRDENFELTFSEMERIRQEKWGRKQP